MTRADAEQAAREIAPCNCQPHKDGSHWYDCPGGLANDIALALIAAHNRAVEAAAEACDGFPDTRMTPEEEAANLMAYGGPSDCEYGCSSLLAHRLRALRIPEEAPDA